MSDLVVIDPGVALDRASDPGEFVVLALERGKSWLAEALAHGDLDALVNAKGYAETLRVAVVQKQLGKDAELSAQELVRRAERCIGLGIRRGQEAGEIRVRGECGPLPDYERNGRIVKGSERGEAPGRNKTSPKDFFNGGQDLTDTYAVTDGVSDEQFEDAIEEAKAEKNLSRRNVVRKLRGEKVSDKVGVATELAANGHTTSQIAQLLGYSRKGMRDFLDRHGVAVPADAVVGKQRNLDSTRIVAATVDAVNGIGMLFDRINYSALDPVDVGGWLPILNDSIRSLTTLRNRLKEVASRD